jgi:hypothetical protein
VDRASLARARGHDLLGSTRIRCPSPSPRESEGGDACLVGRAAHLSSCNPIMPVGETENPTGGHDFGPLETVHPFMGTPWSRSRRTPPHHPASFRPVPGVRARVRRSDLTNLARQVGARGFPPGRFVHRVDTERALVFTRRRGGGALWSLDDRQAGAAVLLAWRGRDAIAGSPAAVTSSVKPPKRRPGHHHLAPFTGSPHACRLQGSSHRGRSEMRQAGIVRIYPCHSSPSQVFGI